MKYFPEIEHQVWREPCFAQDRTPYFNFGLRTILRIERDGKMYDVPLSRRYIIEPEERLDAIMKPLNSFLEEAYGIIVLYDPSDMLDSHGKLMVQESLIQGGNEAVRMKNIFKMPKKPSAK